MKERLKLSNSWKVGMISIVGLLVCPLFCLYSSSDARLRGVIWLDILGVAGYLNLCVGTDWATFKFEPHSNFQAIVEVDRTSHRYHFVPLYLADWFRGDKQHGIKHYNYRRV